MQRKDLLEFHCNFEAELETRFVQLASGVHCVDGNVTRIVCGDKCQGMYLSIYSQEIQVLGSQRSDGVVLNVS